MEAQRLLDAAPFAPDIIQLLKQAFDEAWATLAPMTAADMIGDIRLSLAHAIIAHATKGECDLDHLKAAALEAVRKHPPRTGGD
jgi:hypothetical protein